MNDVAKISFAQYIQAFTRTQGAGVRQNLPKTMPGHVSKILENDYLEFTFDMIGPYTLPKIKIPQNFSKYHREPTAVGDRGYAIPNDYALTAVTGNDGSTPNTFPRGNLSTLSFQPVSNVKWPKKDPNLFLVTGGSAGHKTQSADESTFKLIDAANNILHQSSASIQHIAQDAISHIAKSGGITQAAVSGAINLVQHQLHIGAPDPTVTFDLENPPIPSLPTIVNLIGSMAASGSMSAAGGMSSGGQPVMTAPVPPQLVNARVTVTGSRQGNLALASLLTALVTLGLITDSTTA